MIDTFCIWHARPDSIETLEGADAPTHWENQSVRSDSAFVGNRRTGATTSRVLLRERREPCPPPHGER